VLQQTGLSLAQGSLWRPQLNTGTLGGPMERLMLERLLAADSPLHWECPPDFDYPAELAAVDNLRPTFEAIIGHPVDLDRNVQDAAFFSELAYQAAPRTMPIGSIILTYVAVRFSCFGRLVTIWGNVPETPISNTLELALAVELENRGYCYVPAATLDEPYSGPNVHAASIATWWLRFFDYC
jgi:hypothetical protein